MIEHKIKYPMHESIEVFWDTPENDIGYVRPFMYDLQLEGIFNNARYGVIEASTKSGKAQPKSERVLTPSGWAMVGDIEPGDYLIGSNGKPVRVLEVFPQGVRDVYSVSFSDGTKVRCDLDHLWAVEYYGDHEVLTTRELLDVPEWKRSKTNTPTIGAVEYATVSVPIDPYALGLLIGDGGMSGSSLIFSSADDFCVDALRNAGATVDYRRGVDYVVRTPRDEQYYEWNMALRDLGLWGKKSDTKFVPDLYKYNDIDTRLSLLQGIMDSDGSVDSRGQPVLEQTSKVLADDVREIVESLGGFVKQTTKHHDYLPVYRQRLVVPDARECFRLPRKRERASRKKKRTVRFIRDIEFCGREECVCFDVEAEDSLYVTNGHIVTHNTHGCIVWIAEQAVLYGGVNKNYWWVAPVSDQADIAFRRMKQALPQDMFVANESRKYIKLWNGSLIWFKSADKPDSLYGEDVYAAVVDEATRCKDDSWHALRSTLTATKGNVRIIGNVKGRANWMYRIARLAQGGNEPGMHYVKITAYDAAAAGVIEYEEIENAKKIYPELVFRELYLAEPADDGGNPFGLGAIQACIGPMSQGEPVAWGWDVAKYNNYTVGIALDADGKVCRFHRFQENWETTIPRMTKLTGRKPAMIDSTGSGDQVLERLRANGHRNFRGYVFGGWKSKQDIMLGLAVSIQNREITFPDGVIVEELEAFEYQVKDGGRVLYAAPNGVHDDCVDALAMAVALWQNRNKYSGNAVPILLGKASQWRIG